MSDNNIAEQVRGAIYQASLCLDEARWDDWLGLCHDEFYYAIRAFSPEINVDTVSYTHLTLPTKA